MQLATASRVLGKAILRLLLLALILGGPAVLIYLGTVGFPTKALDALCAQISSSNYSVSIKRLTYHPWNGLVGHELGVRNADGKELLLVNRVDLLLDVGQLLQRHVAFDALKLAGATLTIPIRPDFEMQLKDVRARLSLESNKLKISQFDFRWEKIWFSITGTLLNPAQVDLSAVEASPQSEQFIRVLRQVAAVMADVHYGQRSPTLQCEVNGDLTKIQDIEISKFVAKAPRLRWRKLALSDVICEANYVDGVLHVRHLKARDRNGSLMLSGRYQWANRLGGFSITSSLNPTPIIKSIHSAPELQEFSFTKAPVLEIEGQLFEQAGRAFNYRLVGGIECNDFQFRKVALSHFVADFIWENDQFLSREAKLVTPGINMVMDAHLKSNVLNFRLKGAVNPTVCLPWFDAGLRRIIREIEFVDPVQIGIEGQVLAKDPSSFRGNGVLEAGRAGMRGSWIDSGQARMRFEEGLVAYDNVIATQGTQTASADLVYDFKRRELRFSNVRSEWMPYDILIWVDPKIADAVKPYRFNKPPLVTGQGIVDLDRHQERNRITAEVNAPAGLNYDLLGKTLTIGATRALLEIKDNRLLADVQEANLYDGQVRVEVDVSLDPKNAVYSANAVARHIDFPKLTKLYFDYDVAKGWMDAQISFQAPIFHTEDLVGSGSIHVQDGNVFAIPILGPLSVILKEIIPGAGYQTAREATAEFVIRKQTIHTKKFEIEGKGFSVLGEGYIYFTKDRMNMTARINAQGLPGVVFFPVSKLFEYVSDGSMSNPIWRPKRIPSQLFNMQIKKE